MRGSLPLVASASLLLSTTFAFPHPHPDAGIVARSILSKRTEPNTGEDLPDTDEHPNQLDQVETAFNDALELASYVLNVIDTDSTIFPHYFNEGDRAGVKNVYAAILGTTSTPEGPTTGNDLLGKLLVQTTDTSNLCGDGLTLAYTTGHDTDSPFIVLCPNAFKKKAVTSLKGAENPRDNPDDEQHYIQCEDLQDQGSAFVSYKMNSLGATLLHEYTHYDGLVEFIFGAPIIDQDNGYGPVNVYDNLDKGLSPLNADSYMYYSLHVLWTTLCQPPNGFAAPRAGIDDEDPDCGGLCQN